MRRLPPLIFLVLLTAGLARAPRALAQGGPGGPMGGPMVQDLGGASSSLTLVMGQGRLIRLGAPARSVYLADPGVADIDVKSPTLVYVSGKSPGVTSLIALDAQDRIEANIEVRTVYDATRIEADIRQLAPDVAAKVTTSGQTLVLSGTAQSAADAELARTIASRYTPDAQHLVNNIAVAASNEVNLRVRVAEVSREVVKQFGFNWSAVGSKGSFNYGLTTGTATLSNAGPGLTPTAAANPIASLDNILLGFNSSVLDFNLLLDALETEDLITVLAEPNLTAVSGAPANFLAGGEYPIPVPQSLGVTTIDYKDYGVSLTFVATILSGGRISLKVQPEVSELTNQGAITINGVTIPALTERRAETTVDLASGQSLAIAGLLQNNYNQSISRFPGLGSLPVLGSLFRSDSFQHDETELVIIVTPYIVKPSNGRLAAPTDGYLPPSDAARLLYGEGSYTPHDAAAHAPLTLSGRALAGPSGFELE
ncbi:MAG: type II and III secretion system protein family protein [Alphaproteobacteria bacterium]|nr:type II and III secretion system protein family protein [Alphaproteobacteria bacterium]